MLDQPRKTVLAEGRASGADQLDGQVGVSVGEVPIRRGRERPLLGRTTAALGRAFSRLHQSFGPQRLEMLTNGNVGHLHAGSEFGGRCRAVNLQPIQHTPLRRAQLLCHRFSLAITEVFTFSNHQAVI